MVKRFLILYIYLQTILSSSAQDTPQQIQFKSDMAKAQKAFDLKKYNTAATLYQKLYSNVKEEGPKRNILFMIAESYRKSNNFKKALDWCEQFIDAKYADPKIIYYYGLLLKNFERYDEAAIQFNDYLFEVPADADGEREMRNCNVFQSWKANPKRFNVNNIEELNTPLSEYSPFYTNNKLIYSSTKPKSTISEIFEWTGQKYCDLLESKLENNAWSKPMNLEGDVNTNYNEGAAWLDSSASVMYYTQCNGADGKGMNCKIYFSFYQNNLWITPKMLPFCSDSFSVGHPAFSPDGKILYFASDMPGGFGGKDIYLTTHDALKDKWGKPVNLGPVINTKEDDMFPYVDENNVIYYSSKGNIGMGGLDIYRTRDSSGTYTLPENLQYPINSGGDDFGISFVPKSEIKDFEFPIGYLCSNREGGKGDDDLYSITLKKHVFTIKGKVFDKEKKTVLQGAQVAFKDNSGLVIFKINTNEKGEFNAEVPLNKIVRLSASFPKYFTNSSLNINSMNITKDTSTTVTLYLSLIPSPDHDFTLKGIYYDLDKSFLRPKSKKILDSLIIILDENPTIIIEIGSHTDSRAPYDYNIKLSQRRAESCVNYLLQHEIDLARLVPVGYGERKLVNNCSDGVECTDDQHQANRRTTFRILNTDYKRRRK